MEAGVVEERPAIDAGAVGDELAACGGSPPSAPGGRAIHARRARSRNASRVTVRVPGIATRLHASCMSFKQSSPCRPPGGSARPDTSRPPPPSVTTGTPPSRSRTLAMPAQLRRGVHELLHAAAQAARAGAGGEVRARGRRWRCRPRRRRRAGCVPGGDLAVPMPSARSNGVGPREQGAQRALHAPRRAAGRRAGTGMRPLPPAEVDESAPARRRRGGEAGGAGGEDHGSYKSGERRLLHSPSRRPADRVVRPAPPVGFATVARLPFRAVPGPVEVLHYTDPACPWAYSAEPFLRALEWRYGDRLAWRHVMIGLTEDYRQYEQRGLLDRGPDDRLRPLPPPLRHALRRRRRASACSLSGRACRAVVAARARRARSSPTRCCARCASRGSPATG